MTKHHAMNTGRDDDRPESDEQLEFDRTASEGSAEDTPKYAESATAASETNTDSVVREAPHAGSQFDAGTGQGTISKFPDTGTIDRPVLDGSTENAAAQRSTENPFRGRSDPALGEFRYGAGPSLPPERPEDEADPADVSTPDRDEGAAAAAAEETDRRARLTEEADEIDRDR